ncbi:MAG: hypothetical protein MUF18_05110 [Fimbriiglobus sp.]|jgi:hypothetical protein|nr:hypothetical protein [Fimbriiglobus sp.]
MIGLLTTSAPAAEVASRSETNQHGLTSWIVYVSSEAAFMVTTAAYLATVMLLHLIDRHPPTPPHGAPA